MSDKATLEKLRPCGHFELYSTARHHLGFFKNVACAATYNISSTAQRNDLQDVISRAMHKLIARHAMLSAIVLNEDKKDSDVYFARLPSIDLRTCVEFAERKHIPEAGGKDEELEAILQNQHRLNFREDIGSKPFWRLLVLLSPGNQSNFTAIWIFHHALGDGGSGPIFHRSLLSAINTQHPGGTVSHVVTSPSYPLLPKFEDLHAHPISWPFFFRTILGSIFPSYFAPRAPRLWTGPPITAPDPLPSSKVQLLSLSAPITTQLLRLSRDNKTTLQATLECCIANALFSVIPADTYDRLKASGPISMRSMIRHDGQPVKEDEFALALSEYTYTHTRASHSSSPDKFPWDEARSVRSAIQTVLANNGTDNPVSLLRYVSDTHKYFTEKIGQERDVSFELSNLGLVKTPVGNEDEWKIGQCVFSQSPNITGPPIVCSAITGGDGCCVLAFTWLDGVVEDEMARAVVESVEKQLRGLAGGLK